MLEVDIVVQRGRFRLEAEIGFDATVTGLFGASGSGKTTLLHCIAGLTRPDSGRMTLDGDRLFDSGSNRFVPPHLRHIGLVFQDAQLFPHLTVNDNLLYGYRRRAPSERQFQLQPILELLDIGHLQERATHRLSGGEKQRVALGRALLFSPRLLLLDEPLSALDNQLKRQISPFLRRIRDEIGIPIIYVSHALEEILYLTRHLAVMAGGSILGHGHYLDVFAKTPQSPIIPNDVANIWAMTLDHNDVDHGFGVGILGGQRITLPLAGVAGGNKVTVGVRASQIALSRQAILGTTIQNQLEGRIVRLIPRTHGVLVEVDLGGTPLVAEVSAKALEALSLELGDQVYCLIKAQAFDYLDERLSVADSGLT